MAKKKITLELNDSQYKNLVKILALGEFVLQGHKNPNKQIEQMLSSIYSYAEHFDSEDMVIGPLSIGEKYEIDDKYMSDIIEECFDMGMIADEEDVRFMLKQSES
ncbi:MAG: hypothetical protein C0596_19140 [Marinilabiliales bacterium]|nr:MAG: hypothetical protein C0596_19140 [Marinilabiliales bacterium]